MLNWSVNLTMLFKEVPFLQRFDAAAQAGFAAVEFMWPIGVDVSTLPAAQAASGMQVALFNVDSGDVPGGERGFPNVPEKRDWWRERLLTALDLAAKLNCTRINIQAGNETAGLSRAQMLDCLTENISWAIDQSEGVTFFLEPLNRFEHPRYLLSRTSEALEVIGRVNSPRLMLQYDIYHTQRTEGNLAKLLQTHIAHIGHIQIADSPARNQPGTGEIHWPYLFAQIEALNYGAYIGLEYNPLPDSAASFSWLPPQKRRSCQTSDLLF